MHCPQGVKHHRFGFTFGVTHLRLGLGPGSDLVACIATQFAGADAVLVHSLEVISLLRLVVLLGACILIPRVQDGQGQLGHVLLNFVLVNGASLLGDFIRKQVFFIFLVVIIGALASTATAEDRILIDAVAPLGGLVLLLDLDGVLLDLRQKLQEVLPLSLVQIQQEVDGALVDGVLGQSGLVGTYAGHALARHEVVGLS